MLPDKHASGGAIPFGEGRRLRRAPVHSLFPDIDSYLDSDKHRKRISKTERCEACVCFLSRMRVRVCARVAANLKQ